METMDNNSDRIKTVVEWGDSLIAEVGGRPYGVWGWLKIMMPDRQHIKEGIGGQNFQQIAARHGSSPAKITVAGGRVTGLTPVAITLSVKLYSTPADKADRHYSGTVNGNPVFITRTGATDLYTIQSAGDPATFVVPDGSEFIPDHGFNARYFIQILWWGRNNAAPFRGLNEAYERAIDYMETPRRFLIIGILNSPSEPIGTSKYDSIVTQNDMLRVKYGERYVESTPPTDDDMLAIGYSKTEQDAIDISNGIFPTRMRSSGVHLNTIGYHIFALRIVRKFQNFRW